MIGTQWMVNNCFNFKKPEIFPLAFKAHPSSAWTLLQWPLILSSSCASFITTRLPFLFFSETQKKQIQHRQCAILSRSKLKFSKCYFLITLNISQNVFIAFIRLKRCEKTESMGLSFKAVHPLELLHIPGSGCIKLNTLLAKQSLVSNVMMKGCAFVSLALN